MGQSSAYYGGFVAKARQSPRQQLASSATSQRQVLRRSSTEYSPLVSSFDYSDDQQTAAASYGGDSGDSSSYGNEPAPRAPKTPKAPVAYAQAQQRRSPKSNQPQRRSGYGPMAGNSYGNSASSGGYSSGAKSGNAGGYGGAAEPAYEKPMPYSFKYDIDDGYGATQERQEVKDDYGNVKGSYGYMDANGIYRKVYYTAGPEGFKATVSSNEPGVGTTDNPADTVFNVEDPPAGSYGSRNSYSSSSSQSSGYGNARQGSSSGGGGAYQPAQQQQLQSDYSHMINKIAHKTGGPGLYGPSFRY
ncbi:Cuticle protein 16.8 [Halotydeus destructor]|nr:Cuticle protein 16.8 [Halotydeus destructor]